MMTPDLQSVLAPIVVTLAVAYLAHRWWTRRQRGSTGCASSGECACPAPKLTRDKPSRA